MKLKSFNYLISLLLIFTFSTIKSEEKIDIWSDKKENTTKESPAKDDRDIQEKIKLKNSQTVKPSDQIKIQESSSIETDEAKVYGIYDPSNYDFNLNMWSSTKAEDLRSSLKRLNKIELSKSSMEILETFYFLFHIHQKE